MGARGASVRVREGCRVCARGIRQEVCRNGHNDLAIHVFLRTRTRKRRCVCVQLLTAKKFVEMLIMTLRYLCLYVHVRVSGGVCVCVCVCGGAGGATA